MDFLKWYKNIVESSREDPPLDVWENIQDELDVDMVWENLDASLSKNKRRVMVYRLAAAASLLLIIGFGTLFLYNALYNTVPETYVFNTFELSDQDTILPIRKKESLKDQETYFVQETQYLETEEMPEDFKHEQVKPLITEYGLEEALQAIPRLAHQQYLSTHESQIVEQLAQIYFIDDTKEEQRILTTGKYYAGLTGHAANTWLMNNKTVQGLKSDELTATLPSFGYNIGIIAGRNINRNLSLQVELYLISQARQNYNEYVHGQYVSNNMEFNYTSFSLVGKRSVFNSQKKSGNHHLILGVYTGVLRNAIQNLNGTSLALDNDYSSTDYGVIGGYEYTYPFGNNLKLGTGFQVKYGLKNIFSGNEYIPDYLNNTRNASINLTLSIKYDLN